MNCSNCGAFLGEADAFCGECGQPVPRRAQSGPAPSPEEVRDRETELLPPLPPPAAPRATGPVKVSLARWPVIAGLLAAALGCMCAVVAILVILVRMPGNPTPVVESPVAAALYEDNFDEPGGWDVYDDEDTWAGYVEGGYRLGVRRAEYITWGNPEDQPQFADLIIEVDARQVEGPLDNNLGVLVRYQGDDNNFYWFQISSDGYYAVDLMQAGEWVTLVSWETSTAIHQGLDVVNHMVVECDGSQFDLSVNGTHLATVSDANFGSGSIGLAAGTFGEPGVVIEFDNLKVTELEE